MEYRDYYKILGVDKKATAAEIKKAFRAMAVKYHPDKNPDNKEAEEKFKLANEANEVLGNPEKRKKYDTLGENWQQNYQREKTSGSNTSQQQQYDSRNQGDPIDGFSDFSDFFEQIFGNGPKSGGRSQARKGVDYETTLEITLEDAFAGTSKIIQLDAEKIRMTIKPGVAQDQVLKIKGKGAAGASKELNGDLYAKINIRPHHYFTRKGNDLYATQTIDLYTAVLGGEFLVRTINGQVKMNVAEGTQNGKSLRLKGKGMPAYDAANVFGDLYIQLQIQTPDKLSPKQRELFTQLKNTQ